MSEFDFAGRLQKLSEKFSVENIGGILVSKPENVRYFSGFAGDSTILIITKNSRKLVTDGRYTEQAKLQTKDFEIVLQTDGLFKKVGEEVKKLGAKTLGFEGKSLTFDEHSRLSEILSGVALKSVEVDSLRQVKDAAEVERIRAACRIADRAFAEVLNHIRPGVREIDVAAELESLMRRFGAEKPSFDTIVASGVRGSLPHGTATEKVIAAGELVTMDFGAICRGYCSDITRTVCVGKISPRLKEIYDAVREAQSYGLQVIKPGKSGKEVDAAVREKLSAAGFGEYFTHSLGHSLGLEIHEEPRLSRFSKCESLLPGMVVTDEPGIYIPGFGGVRIEDTVLITQDGAEPLTQSPKDLIEVSR